MSAWGIYIPPDPDRPNDGQKGWLRPIDDCGGVDCAMVFRSEAEAERALMVQGEKWNMPERAEVRPFDWALEPA